MSNRNLLGTEDLKRSVGIHALLASVHLNGRPPQLEVARVVFQGTPFRRRGKRVTLVRCAFLKGEDGKKRLKRILPIVRSGLESPVLDVLKTEGHVLCQAFKSNGPNADRLYRLVRDNDIQGYLNLIGLGQEQVLAALGFLEAWDQRDRCPTT